MLIDITQILTLLFELILAVIGAFAIPYIRAHTSAAQQTEINEWVRIAVMAAEQIYSESGKGREKKAYVVKWLTEHGIMYDEGTIDAMIESTVYALKEGVI